MQCKKCQIMMSRHFMGTTKVNGMNVKRDESSGGYRKLAEMEWMLNAAKHSRWLEKFRHMVCWMLIINFTQISACVISTSIYKSTTLTTSICQTFSSVPTPWAGTRISTTTWNQTICSRSPSLPCQCCSDELLRLCLYEETDWVMKSSWCLLRLDEGQLHSWCMNYFGFDVI